VFPALPTIAVHYARVRVKHPRRYSHWIPSMGRHAAESMDEALG
jgi:hypothetical protein